MIIDDLIELALSRASRRKVKDVRAGLGYTCIMLEDDSCGLAYTFRNELGCCCGILDDAGSLIGRDGGDVIQWAKNSDRLKAAIGLASINAVLNTSEGNWDTENVTSTLDADPSDTFGMVGDFKPILAAVQDKVQRIYVFEQNVPEGSGLYSEDAIPECLPECDIVVITATSIINHTIDKILPHCRYARQVCLVGPSTPLCPEVFGQYHVNLLAGSVVTDAGLILQTVSQGGGTMSMKPAMRQVIVKV
jgi:hypothetical protein